MQRNIQRDFQGHPSIAFTAQQFFLNINFAELFDALGFAPQRGDVEGLGPIHAGLQFQGPQVRSANDVAEAF